MQGKNAPNGEFLHRTNVLAKRLDCSIEALSAKMGLSKRTVILGRSGAKVSQKTWTALETLEKQAGLKSSTSEENLVIENSATYSVDDYILCKQWCETWLHEAEKHPKIAKHMISTLELHLPMVDLHKYRALISEEES